MSNSYTIRSLDSGKLPDKYWTGSKFSSDINEVKEFTSGRALANEISRAKIIAQSDNTITQKGVLYTELFDSVAEEDAYKDTLRAIQKRSTDTSVNNIDVNILKSDGSIDGDKLQTLIEVRLAEARVNRSSHSLLSTGGTPANNDATTYGATGKITKPAGFYK
jgi:hypothetical protein